jgi:hypothetical protein
MFEARRELLAAELELAKAMAAKTAGAAIEIAPFETEVAAKKTTFEQAEAAVPHP